MCKIEGTKVTDFVLPRLAAGFNNYEQNEGIEVLFIGSAFNKCGMNKNTKKS